MHSMALSPTALRALLPPPAPEMPGLRTGIEQLDATLVGGGLPRGRLTEIVGARGSGKTTLLRQIVETTVEQSGWVAYIDATRTLSPRDWAHLGTREGVWMVRPTDGTRAAWCADVLLRCSAFSLVVVDSAPPLTRAIAVRLTRLARESSAALVVVKDDDHNAVLLSGAVRLRVRRERSAPHRGGGGSNARSVIQASSPPPPPPTSLPSPWDRRAGERSVRRLSVVVEKGGAHQTVEVRCAIGVARRLCAHPQVPDRRGVAQRAAGGSGSERRAAPASIPGDRGASGSGLSATADVLEGRAPSSLVEPGARLLPRKRRCAEPDYGTTQRRVRA